MLAWARKWPGRSRIRQSGALVLLTTGLIAAAAVNTGTNLLYLILGGAMSLLVLSAILRTVNMLGVKVSRTVPKVAFRDQPVNAEIRIENRRYLLPCIGLRIELADAPGAVLGYALKVPARRCAHVSTKLSFPKRGVHRVPPTDVVSSFPFGFSDCWRRFDDGAEVVVFPRVRPVRSSALEHTRGESFTSRVASADGDEFFSLRDYIHGDDVRRVSWRASARLGKWVIREMSKDNSRFVIFALDTRWTREDPDFAEHLEEVIELVASFAVMLLSKQYNVAIQTPDRGLDGGEGSGQERRILDFLARAMPQDPVEYPSFEDMVVAMESRAASVVYVSPDPARWGMRSGLGAPRALDPREIVYA